ncbi:MAG TPA: hypothetical protein PLS84_03235 [Salinivirgaceae bacterium]|nr:hypothetical protein [Salinivirgaceae bacterium]
MDIKDKIGYINKNENKYPVFIQWKDKNFVCDSEAAEFLKFLKVEPEQQIWEKKEKGSYGLDLLLSEFATVCVDSYKEYLLSKKTTTEQLSDLLIQASDIEELKSKEAFILISSLYDQYYSVINGSLYSLKASIEAIYKTNPFFKTVIDSVVKDSSTESTPRH